MFFPESISEMPLYPLVWVVIAYFVGRWRMKIRSTWNKRLSFVFSNGFEYTTGLDFVLPVFECSVHLSGSQLTHVVLHDAVGKILPILREVECRGKKYSYTTELGPNQSVILLLETPIDVANLAGANCARFMFDQPEKTIRINL
jgi:hypothetical protein